jgi:protein-S-isoprenylcysteine O-methyltransferase Ste14
MQALIPYIPLIAVLIVYVTRMVEVTKKREVIPGKKQESLTFNLFMIVGTVMTFGSVAEYIFVRWGNFSWIALMAGIVCAIISFKLRWAAIAALGKFWSLHVEMRDNHEFVQSGPFRFLRHPTYFSMILELAAFGLICSAWYMLLIVPFAFIPALIMRLRLEEPALVKQFGDAYRDYQRRVPMVIPYKWPSAK